jgi:hypothetical protein
MIFLRLSRGSGRRASLLRLTRVTGDAMPSACYSLTVVTTLGTYGWPLDLQMVMECRAKFRFVRPVRQFLPPFAQPRGHVDTQGRKEREEFGTTQPKMT